MTAPSSERSHDHLAMDSAASHSTRRRDVVCLLAAMIGTVVLLRAWLFITPNADFTIRGVNIHHLFSGIVLTVVAAIPLALASSRGMRRRVQVAGLGVGIGLMLDEWVYLIATDGSNASYPLPISGWGAVGALGFATAYTLYCHARAPQNDARGGGTE